MLGDGNYFLELECFDPPAALHEYNSSSVLNYSLHSLRVVSRSQRHQDPRVLLLRIFSTMTPFQKATIAILSVVLLLCMALVVAIAHLFRVLTSQNHNSQGR